MPKKLAVHPNERIDVPDFDHAATIYTDESLSFLKERFLIDRRSRVIDGFRVEVSDQTATPGQITVYNGNAIDRSGVSIADEDQANSSITVTLSGSSQTFYVEVEFTEAFTDTDSRGFWDPTYDNGVGVPTGKEVDLSVATRSTPTWKVVYPISTTGFDFTTNPNSTRVPLVKLTTNGSNQITGVVNTLLSQVVAASVIESDTAAGSTKLRVFDSRFFPDTGTVSLDAGGTNPETSLTLVSNDRENGILTINPATVYSHSAGAIVKVTGVTGRLIKENVDPNATAMDTASPNHVVDQTRRFFQGNEIRGGALASSKETTAGRDDLNLRSVKDYVDFVAGQIREMKFGSPRTEITSISPPSSFSSRPRYFDNAGSITGARTASITIGNGTTTFGDYNGSTNAVFTAAIAALPSGGRIYVKPGTYTFTSSVAIPTNITIIGDSKDDVILVNNVAASYIFSVNNATVGIESLTFQSGTGGTDCLSITNGTVHAASALFTGVAFSNGTFNLRDGLVSESLHGTQISGRIYNSVLSGSFTTVGTFVQFEIDGCSIATDPGFVNFTSGTTYSFMVKNSFILSSQFSDTPMFLWDAGSTSLNVVVDSCLLQNSVLDCSFQSKPGIFKLSGAGNLTIANSYVMVNGQNTAAGREAVGLRMETNAANFNVAISNTKFINYATYTTGIYTFGDQNNKISISGCDFYTNVGIQDYGSAATISVANSTFYNTQTTDWYGFKATYAAGTDITRVQMTGCTFRGNTASTAIQYGFYNASGVAANLTNCKFSNLQYSSGVNYPIYFNVSSATVKPVELVVDGCSFYDCYGSTTSALVHFLNTSGYVRVTGNTFSSCKGRNAIFVSSAFMSDVSNNKVYNFSNGAAATEVIYVNTVSSSSTISDNEIDLVTVLASSGALMGIRADGLNTTTGSQVITGNIISNVNSSGTVAVSGNVYGISTTCRTTVSKNRIFNVYNSSNQVSGIYLGVSGRNTSITNNTIDTLVTTAAVVRGIDSTQNQTGLTITGNTIYGLQSTTTGIIGIYLAGTSYDVDCSLNNLESFTCTSTTHGIRFVTLVNSKISGNLFRNIDGTTACNIVAIYSFGGTADTLEISNNKWYSGALNTSGNACYFVFIDPNAGATGSYTNLTVVGNQFSSTEAAGTVKYPAIMKFKRCSGTTIERNIFSYAGAITYGIYVDGSDKVTVGDNSFVNATSGSDISATIYFDGTTASGTTLLGPVKIVRNNITFHCGLAAAVNAIYLMSTGINLTNVTVSNNQIVQSGTTSTSYAGVTVTMYTTAQVRGLNICNNSILDLTSGGILGAMNAYGISVAGASAGKVRNVNFSDNNISLVTSGATNRGIQLNYGSFGTICNNDVEVSNSQYEISLFTCENLLVQDNILGTNALGTYVVLDLGVANDATGTNNTIQNNKL